jgi:hypothetical protein
MPFPAPQGDVNLMAVSWDNNPPFHLPDVRRMYLPILQGDGNLVAIGHTILDTF